MRSLSPIACSDQRRADAAAAVLAGDDDHRDVAIEDAVGDRPKEADDGILLDGHQGYLRMRDQFAEDPGILNARAPVIGDHEQSRLFEFVGQNRPDLHGGLAGVGGFAV